MLLESVFKWNVKEKLVQPAPVIALVASMARQKPTPQVKGSFNHINACVEKLKPS